MEPTDVSLLRILVRDLVLAGVASRAGLLPVEDGYVLEVTVERLGASFNNGIETLVAPVLPTSAVEAACSLSLVFKDTLGRVFLRQTFAAEESAVAALLIGLESTAADTLAEAIRHACDAAFPVIHGSVAAFWERLRRNGISPPRERRSSTAR